MKFIVTLVIFFSPYVFSSSFEECKFKIKILEVGKKKTKINSFQIIGEDIEHKKCKKYLGIQTVSNLKIKSDYQLLRKNTIFLGSRMEYSGLGPNGIISSISWHLKPLL